jgi:phage terminase Nu1 subunit (DNA packaging protein)
LTKADGRELVSQAEFARRRGVSRQAVARMVAEGRIPLHRRGRRKVIDPAEADAALEASRYRVDYDDGDCNLARARMKRAGTEARRAELRLKQELGQVLETTDVMQAMQVASREMLQVINRLPDAAPELAALGQGDAAAMRRGLSDMARKQRTELAKSMRLLDEVAA